MIINTNTIQNMSNKDLMILDGLVSNEIIKRGGLLNMGIVKE